GAAARAKPAPALLVGPGTGRLGPAGLRDRGGRSGYRSGMVQRPDRRHRLASALLARGPAAVAGPAHRPRPRVGIGSRTTVAMVRPGDAGGRAPAGRRLDRAMGIARSRRADIRQPGVPA